MTDVDVEAKIVAIIAQIVELPEEDILRARTADMREALGMNSMRAIEIVAEAEREFGIEIDEEKLADIHTVDETLAVVREALSHARTSRPARVAPGAPVPASR
jgi:acyl carrier protein